MNNNNLTSNRPEFYFSSNNMTIVDEFFVQNISELKSKN